MGFVGWAKEDATMQKKDKEKKSLFISDAIIVSGGNI